MPKCCMRCGKQNEDQAAFCVACGAALPEVEQGLPAGSPGENAVASATSLVLNHNLELFGFL